MIRKGMIVLGLAAMLMAAGCQGKEANPKSDVDHQSVTQQVNIGGDAQNDPVETENGAVSGTEEPPGNQVMNPDVDVTFTNQVFSNREPFFYDYYEEVDETDLGNYVLALMDRDGNKVWEAKWMDLTLTELALGWEPVKVGNVIYIGVYGDLYALNAKNGSMIWQAKGTGSTVQPVIQGNQIYMSGYYGPLLSAVDLQTGEVLWRVEDLDDFGETYKIIDAVDGVQLIAQEYKDGEYMDVVLKFDAAGQFQGHDTYTGDLWSPQYWEEITASSTLNAGSGAYEPANIWDQNFETAWVEGAPGYGLTEWIEMKTTLPQAVEYVSIANGYQKSEDTYNENGKLAKYRIDFSNGEYFIADAYYVDQMYSEEHIHLVNPVQTQSVRLTILDAVPGTKYEDLCITEWMTR